MPWKKNLFRLSFSTQVMEVLQLKCGVSVNKMVKATEESQDPAKQWIEIEHSTMHIKEYDSDHCKSEDESDEKIIRKAIHSNHQKEEKEKPLGLSTFLVFLEDRLKVLRHPLCLGRAPSSPN